MHDLRRNPRAGFTVFELLIAITILSLILGGLLTATRTSSGLFNTSMSNSQMESRSRRLLDQMANELASANLPTSGPLDPDLNGSSVIDFQVPQGWEGGSMEWSTLVRYTLELENGELDNGLDDNGNGLVDEGNLVRIEDPLGPSPRRVILAHGISELLEGEDPNGDDDNGNGLDDEPGLCFTLDSGLLAIRVSLLGVDANGTLITRSTETTVALRN